jgi:hypothetical protein
MENVGNWNNGMNWNGDGNIYRRVILPFAHPFMGDGWKLICANFPQNYAHFVADPHFRATPPFDKNSDLFCKFH